MRTTSILLALLATAVAAVAEVRIGNYPIEPVTPVEGGAALPITIVDLSSPATAAGSINTAAVNFFARDCAAGFKVKFFTRSGDTLTQIAERGPFNVNNVLMKITLSPPVTVPAGALIGMTQLTPCALLTGQTPVAGRSAVRFSGDITAANINSGKLLEHYSFGAYGADSSDAQVRTHVIIAAGAAQGSGGALFKTDLFLANLKDVNATGKFVYHPAGTAGTPVDPSFAFDLGLSQSQSLPNFVGQSLGRSGLGSIDVYTTIGFLPPTINARIYDDAGAAGTKGFTFDAFQPAEALQPAQNAVLFAPPDTRSRMNIGVRTLDQGGEIQFILVQSNGGYRVPAVTRQYPANYFIQDTAANIFGGVAPQPGDYVIVYSTQLSYFAYAAITDNATNDPSVQVARHLK